MLNKVLVPLPDLETQLEIITQLDLMDELVSGAQTSLPAEIKARRQQYEHYRDKLLTFKELVA
jgi:type I restriction enzyme S subunit